MHALYLGQVQEDEEWEWSVSWCLGKKYRKECELRWAMDLKANAPRAAHFLVLNHRIWLSGSLYFLKMSSFLEG